VVTSCAPVRLLFAVLPSFLRRGKGRCQREKTAGALRIFLPDGIQMPTYAQKLKDPRWQKKRLEILERDEWMCSHCASTTRTLHVHHLRYAESRDPWDSLTEDLITLCETCHEQEERDRPAADKDLAVALKESGLPIDIVRELARLVNHLGCVIAESPGARFEAIWSVTCGLEGFFELMYDEDRFAEVSEKRDRECRQIAESVLAMADSGLPISNDL
jgi:5-methylcytosine-specific restriction endonuclease McrA